MVIYSSFVRNMWISATPRVSSHPFTYPHLWTLLISNSLLSMMKALLVLFIRLSFTYPHIPDKARINNHQASHLVSIHLTFSFNLSFMTGVFPSVLKTAKVQFGQQYWDVLSVLGILGFFLVLGFVLGIWEIAKLYWYVLKKFYFGKVKIFI